MSRGSAKRRPAARRRRSGGINWVWVIVGVAVVAVIGGLISSLSRQLTVIEGERTYGPFAANQHVSAPVAYTESPPVGGPHYASWQNCGIYDQPVASENAVHSLEHGAVWVAYRPDLPADQVEQLRSQVRGRTYTLLSPFPDLDAPIAVSAWGAQVKVDSADDPRIGSFITKYRQGPQTPEPGALCTNGVGVPIER